MQGLARGSEGCSELPASLFALDDDLLVVLARFVGRAGRSPCCRADRASDDRPNGTADYCCGDAAGDRAPGLLVPMTGGARRVQVFDHLSSLDVVVRDALSLDDAGLVHGGDLL